MKEICFILPIGLPVPNVKGGAIETLITNLINENEKNKKMKFTIISLYNNEAYKLSTLYSMSSFIYIKKDLRYYLKSLKVRIHNFFNKEKYNTYNEYILDKIKDKKFDLIIVEDGNYFSFKHYTKYFDKNKLVLHMHHDGISNLELGNIYSKFIGISNYVTNKFKRNSNIKQYYTLMNGIDLNKFKNKITSVEKETLRKQIGFKKDDFIVLFCGRIIQEKGVIELAQAVSEINNDKVKLLIVGSVNFSENKTSEYEQKLKKIIIQNDKIKITGYIKNDELYRYYQVADIQVVPSVCEEAAGLVAIEGMISGLPLIITNSGGMVEYVSKDTIVVEKKNDIVNSLKNEICKLHKDINKREKMKKFGIETANKFGTESFYNDFYKMVLNMVGDGNE